MCVASSVHHTADIITYVASWDWFGGGVKNRKTTIQTTVAWNQIWQKHQLLMHRFLCTQCYKIAGGCRGCANWCHWGSPSDTKVGHKRPGDGGELGERQRREGVRWGVCFIGAAVCGDITERRN